jgi:hypothetical protein
VSGRPFSRTADQIAKSPFGETQRGPPSASVTANSRASGSIGGSSSIVRTLRGYLDGRSSLVSFLRRSGLRGRSGTQARAGIADVRIRCVSACGLLVSRLGVPVRLGAGV